MRIHGGDPTSSFLLYSLLGDALGVPQGAYLDSPRPREWPAAAGHHRDIFAAYFICPQEIVLRPPNRRIYILPHMTCPRVLADLEFAWEVPPDDVTPQSLKSAGRR